jgi:predicted ester cyclase
MMPNATSPRAEEVWMSEQMRATARRFFDEVVGQGRVDVIPESTWSGTHEGDLFGIPGTGKPFAMNVIDIVRFDGEVVVEHWGVGDLAGMMQQVGLA